MPKKHSNWGGARPGAGRPRRTADVTVAPISTPAEAVNEPIENVETVAAAHAMNALAALVRQLTLGKSEPAKIVAANAILDRAFGRPSVDAGGDAMLPFQAAPSSGSMSAAARREARKHARVAIEALVTIASSGASESARVAAARSLLDRGVGTVGVAKAARALIPEGNTQEDREQRSRDDIIKRALARMQAKVN